MGEEKNTTAEGHSAKKSTSSQKSPAKKSQTEPSKLEAQTKSAEDTSPATSLVKKIDNIVEEIESKPIKSFEKKEQERLIQSYEKLIFKMVREINNSRR